MEAGISILLGILTFLGTSANKAHNHHIEVKAEKVELMKEMCFQLPEAQRDCEPLKLYLEKDLVKDRKKEPAARVPWIRVTGPVPPAEEPQTVEVIDAEN